MATLPGYDYEHLFIDNASTDGTVAILRELAAADKRVKVIVNTRNFGQVRSPYHAFLQARGDAVMTCVADLQDPPELIPQFVEKWEEGYKVVIGVKAGQPGILAHGSRRGSSTTGSSASSRRTWSSSTTSPGSACTTGRSSSSSATRTSSTRTSGGWSATSGTSAPRSTTCSRPARGARPRTTSSASTTSRCWASPTTPRCRCASPRWPGSPSRSSACWSPSATWSPSSCSGTTLQLGLAPLLIGIYFFGAVQLFFIGVLGEYIGSIHTQVHKRPLVVEKERINFD